MAETNQGSSDKPAPSPPTKPVSPNTTKIKGGKVTGDKTTVRRPDGQSIREV